MKKRILLFGIILTMAGQLCLATIWTVSNHPDSPGQFTDLQVAVDSAGAGDTVYVSGSPISYGSIFIKKQLVLIGSGYHPGNQWGYSTLITDFNLEREFDGVGTLVSSPDGTEFMGFKAITIRIPYDTYSDSYGIDSIKISRCRVETITINGFDIDHAVGWSIINCILRTVTGHIYATATTIRNNIFTTAHYIQNINNFDGSTLIANNIFLGTAINSNAFASVKNCQIINNIFYGQRTSGADYCTFSYNISFGSDFMEFLYEHNSGANNFVDTDPQFVDVASTNFSYSSDYHLLPASPGYGGGSNGTDIGIYGGAYPMPSGGNNPYETSAMPSIPQILEMNLFNAEVPVNGTLQVNVKARKQD